MGDASQRSDSNYSGTLSEMLAEMLEVKQSLIGKLKATTSRDTGNFDIVVMPDFFFDHFVSAGSFSRFVNEMNEVYARKGGNILGHRQTFAQGGNAGNMATALSRLGFNVHFIGRTNKLGKAMIDEYLGSSGVDTSHVKADGELATTVALEFENTNVMVSYSGSNGNFGFDSLEERDLTLIERCDLLAISNWSQNRKGTELAEKAFARARRFGVKTYFDTGDPTARKKDVQELKNRVLKKGLVDIYGLNENELQQFSGMKCSNDKELRSAANKLHSDLYKRRGGCRIDFHTASFAYSIVDGKGTAVSAFDIRPYRMTGAGDSWNAGNAFGELFSLTDSERLMFANAFAGAYISSPVPVHPTINRIIEFLKNTNFRQSKTR